MADYTILLRNPRTLALLGELPVFLHARWRRHEREMGDFEITVNRNNVADSLIARNNIVEIRRDGEFEFAGIIRYREIGDPALGGQRGDVWKLSGPDLKWWLTNRLVDPGASQYDSQVGVATETAMKHYVEDHLTAPADADRDVNTELAAGITFEVQPDASRGIDANFNARFDNLLGGCLLPLARGADLLHDVVLLGDYSGYRYEVSEPTDATETVTFSVGWDNVEKLIYREDYLGVRNSMYVLGQGAGAARTVEVVEDADGIAQDFKREGPIDARQADTVAKLQQIGNDRLESLADDALSAHAVPAIVGPTLYREHWDVGYDVTVSISEVGIEMTRRIVEVIVQLTKDKGEDISISLGARPKTQTRQIAEGQQRTNPVMHDGGGGAAGGYDTIEDEGVPLAQRTTIDFVGAGVTATDVAGETRVTIPGAVSAPHNLLDGVTHPDTVAQAVSVGSLVYGDATPDWNELVRVVPGGAALRNVLGLDQGDTVPAWKVSLDAVNPANIAAAASPGTSLLYSHRDHVHAHPAALGIDLHHASFVQADADALYAPIAVVAAPFLTLGLDAGLSNEISVLETDESTLPDTDIHWKWNSASDRVYLIEQAGAGEITLKVAGTSVVHILLGAYGQFRAVGAGTIGVKDATDTVFITLQALSYVASQDVVTPDVHSTAGVLDLWAIGNLQFRSPVTNIIDAQNALHVQELVLSKSTLTIDANDEITVPTTSSVYLTKAGGGPHDLAGIGAGTEGQIVFLTPVAGKDIILIHDGAVTAGKKLMINGEADVTLDEDHDLAIATFDAVMDAWKVMVPGAGGGAGGATTALDNLAAVAINTSLISDTDSTDDLGSAAVRWANVYGDVGHFAALADTGGTTRIIIATSAPHLDIIGTVRLSPAASTAGNQLTITGSGTVGSWTGVRVAPDITLSSGTLFGISLGPIITAGANSVIGYGLFGSVKVQTIASGRTGLEAFGLRFTAIGSTIIASGTGNYAQIIGVNPGVQLLGGFDASVTVTAGVLAAAKLETFINQVAAGTVTATDGYGCWIPSPIHVGAAVIVNWRGLKIDDYTTGSPTINNLVDIGPAIAYFRVPGNVTAVSRETPIYVSWSTAAPAWVEKQLKTKAGDTLGAGDEVCVLA